jgi:4a-hydroxytetrahydrobiopterin dehydratase
MVSDLDTLAATTLEMREVDTDVLRDEVAGLGKRWSIVDGELVLELRGQPMSKHVAVIAHAAKLADELDHHPRIVLEYAGMTLAIHTHDAHAITVTDLVYAARLEQWLRANG